MTTLALALVLAAAVLHAGWNLLAKQADGALIIVCVLVLSDGLDWRQCGSVS